MSIMDFFAASSFLIVFAIALLALLAMSIRVANQYERSVVFRLGKLQQEGITRDNVPIKVDAVIWYRIVDPERAVIEVKTVGNAVVQVSLTTLRTVLGQHTLDEILKDQDTIAEIMQRSIDSVTKPWGVKVELVQMKSVEIPPSMQRAMAQEAEALREKRARLIKAEAELDAAEQLRQAAEVIMQNPAGLELRRMQMITEVGAEQNTMTIIMMPSEFVAMAKGVADAARIVAAKA